MVGGCKNSMDIPKDIGIKNYISIEEYLHIFSYLCPLNEFFDHEFAEKAKKEVKLRLNLTEDDFKFPF